MPEALIIYFGQPAKVRCDGRCDKAWGASQRPAGASGHYLADDELPAAPADPGTREGLDAKPPNALSFPNRWCVRECERCAISKPGQSHLPLSILRFDRRRKPE